jgi:hypothetical protein
MLHAKISARAFRFPGSGLLGSGGFSLLIRGGLPLLLVPSLPKFRIIYWLYDCRIIFLFAFKYKEPAFWFAEMASAERFDRNQEDDRRSAKKHSGHKFESNSKKELR